MKKLVLNLNINLVDVAIFAIGFHLFGWYGLVGIILALFFYCRGYARGEK